MKDLFPSPRPDKRQLLDQLMRKREQGTLEREIAIVGLAGRYPGAPDLFHFWEALKAGRICTSEIPLDRWDTRTTHESDSRAARWGERPREPAREFTKPGDPMCGRTAGLGRRSLGEGGSSGASPHHLHAFYDPDPLRAFEGKAYCKWGGFLDGIRRFDAAFFHVSPREAELMDPQERLFLEVAWSALEDAGYARDLRQPRRAGVFLGVTTAGYPWVLADAQDPARPLFPNASFASMANRVSHFFNFQGPSMPVDTMCSSSLTAVVLACDSILSGACDSALVGGVNLYPHPSKYLGLCQLGLVSQDGLTRSFGAGGMGFVPGEGVGAIFLKPLLQALKDGDPIYATILGGALGHAGKSSSYLAPNPGAQAALAFQALKNAGVSARSISYVEAQGLGSELVDAVEIAGLTRAFRQFTEDRQFCAMGTLKPNFGHAEAASGIAQLTKVLLQLRWRTLCPSVIHDPLNPDIRFEESPFFLQRDLHAWPGSPEDRAGEVTEQPRRAMVCAYGAGGSSAHVIVEEFPFVGIEPPTTRSGPCLVPFSARSRASLHQALRNHLDYLRRPEATGPQDGQFLRNLAFTLQTRREAMPERFALVADSCADLVRQLETTLATEPDNHSPSAAARNSESRSTGEDPVWAQARQAGQAWARGEPLAEEALIRARQAWSIPLPAYAFEPTAFWVGGRQDVSAPAPEPVSRLEVRLHSSSGQHRQFFESLGGYYRCLVLHWFQRAGWLLPGAEVGMDDLLHRWSSSDSTRAWIRWLLAWLEAGQLVSEEAGRIRLTEWGQSREIQEQIRGLAERRGLILRAIPELEPQMQLLDLTGEAFLAGFEANPPGASTPAAVSLLRAVFGRTHRFAEELEAEVGRTLEENLPGLCRHPPASVRVREIGLGSFGPLRAALTFFHRLGCSIEVEDDDPGEVIADLKRELARAISPSVRVQSSALTESLADHREAFTLTLARAFTPWGRAEASSPDACPGREGDSGPGGLRLRLEDGEGDFRSLVLGRLDPRWLQVPQPVEPGALPRCGRSAPGAAGCFPVGGRIAAVAEEGGMLTSEAVEALVRAAVARVLGVAEVEVDREAPFRDYALHSIMLAQVYLELKNNLGDWVSPSLLLQEDSVAKLARALVVAAPTGDSVPSHPQRAGQPNETGSAPASGAVFRALAENTLCVDPCEVPGGNRVLKAQAVRARPATPEAGVLPNFGDRIQAVVPGALAGATVSPRGGEASHFRAPSGWDMEFFLEGAAAGEPVLVLTALAFTKGIWEHQVRELGEKYRLIFPHLPGHGGSGLSSGGFSFESLADDLLALLDDLEIRKVHLVGWCMAGNIGQLFATRHAARLQSLTLVCTTPTDARRRGLSSEDLQTYAQSPLYTYEVEFQNLVRSGWLSGSAKAELLERVHRDFCAVDPVATLHYIEHLFRFDTRAHLGQVNVPALVLAGRCDIAFPADQVRLLHEGIRGSRFHEFQKSGHLPFLTQPDLFNYLLVDFLQSAKHSPDSAS